MTTKPTLQKTLKGILHTERKDKCNHKHMGMKKIFHLMSR
jgi:hypothetical protein